MITYANKTKFHLHLLDMRLVIANAVALLAIYHHDQMISYPTRTHGVILLKDLKDNKTQ